MNSIQFTRDALRTESRPQALAFSKEGTYKLLGLLVEAAAVADTCKRAIFYGKPLAKDKLLSHINDLIVMADSLRQLAEADTLAGGPGDTSGLHAPNLRLLHGAVGIFGEAGEILEALEKQMLGKELDLVNVAEETGDVDWYKAIIHDETGVAEEMTRSMVIAKLRVRYPNKFDSDAATTRNLDAERAVLEKGLS